MKNINKKIIFIIALIFNSSSIINAGYFNFWPFDFGKNFSEGEKIIIASGLQGKRHQLAILKKEKENFTAKEKEFIDEIQNELNDINKRILDVKEKLKEPKFINDHEHLNKVLAKLNEISQILIDIKILNTKLLNDLEQHIELLESYIKDPSFKGKTVESKSSYNFEDLQKLNREIFSSYEELSNLNEEKNSYEVLLESYKKELPGLEKELKANEKEQKKFITKPKNETDEDELTIRQRSETLDLDVLILNAKKKLLDLKIKEAAQKLALISTRIFIVESIIKVLKEDLQIVDRGIWVSESDVELAKKNLEDKKQESTELKTKYSQEISQLSLEKEKLKHEFESLSKKYKIHFPDIRILSDWSIDAKNHAMESVLYRLGFINERILTIDREIALKEAQKELEKKRIQNEEILVNIITSWYKISQKKFRTEEDINSEKKKYEAYKAEANRELAIYKDQITSVTNLLNNHGKVLNNIKEKIKDLNKRQDRFSLKYGKEAFNKSIEFLTKIEEQINIQNDLNNKIIENYSGLIGNLKDQIEQVSAALVKIDSIGGILLRSEYAISLESLKNIVPDLKLFTIDLRNIIYSFVSDMGIKNISRSVQVSYNAQSIFYIFFIFIFLIILFFILKKALPYIYSQLLSIRPAIRSLYFINCLMAVIVGFVLSNFLGIFIWSAILFLIKIGAIVNLGLKVIFYLFSILYLCYLSHKFVSYLLEFNKKNNYVLLNQSFQKRFARVFLFFIYSTIIILFFREAFISITYGKSELPTILLALYSIIFRASLIFLIGKEEILSIFPSKGPIWSWIRKQISNFYYIILAGIVAIMVISDPYIGGFSKLVSFILWSIFFTILLLTGLWWLQILIRRLSFNIFFSTDEDETVKERFQHGKTLYGLFSVFSFIFFILLIIFVGAKIWNLPLSLDGVSGLLNRKIFDVRGEEGLIPITLKSFFTIFIFLFSGFIFAWSFDRFILRRMFNALLVDQGVQNTVSSISYYFIVITILLVGLFRVGLGGLIPFLVGALAVGLAFAIKGPANDFIGYFIILVERSIKIGDYVEIDENTKGIVRKISPRSIIIRRKNSVSIIVPNSRVTNAAFYNWNYVHGFFAFDDIILTVPFNIDPAEVRNILLDVLDKNTNILKSPSPIIRLNDFSENGYVFMVRGFLSSINVINQWDIASDLRFSIVKALFERGIQIASPVRRIYVTSTDRDTEKTQKY